MAVRQRCRFFLLRYVPDAVKNEFVNVGLVLLPQTGPAELRFTSDWSRVRCLDPEADLEMLEAVQRELNDNLRNAGLERDLVLRKIQDSFSNAIQASDLTACLAEQPAAEADELARLYLERPRRTQTREASARQQIFQRMRDEFERTGVWDLMNKNVPVARYTRSGDPLKIDCGYTAQGAVKMFHSLALQSDVNSAKVLAYSFPHLAEGIAREEKAQAMLTAIVEDDLTRTDDAISFALETLEQQQIQVVPVSQMPDIAAAAARELRV